MCLCSFNVSLVLTPPENLSLDLKGLIAAVQGDRWLNNLDDAEQAQLLADLEKHWETTETGARMDNKAAALDVGYTTDVLLREVSTRRTVQSTKKMTSERTQTYRLKTCTHAQVLLPWC